MKPCATIFIIWAIASSCFAQLTVQNQLEFTRREEDKRNILENWTDLNLQKDFMQVGLRYEINHPPDPFIFPQDSLLAEYMLSYRHAEFTYKNLIATVGHFYTMFGRGLTLRTYEERNLRVDNNMDGLRLNISGSCYHLEAVTGKMRDKYNRRKEMLYGVDGDLKVLKNVKWGASYLYQDRRREQLWASRFQGSFDWGEFYTEVVKPDWHSRFSSYASVSLTFSKFALSAEYKDYDRLSFRHFYGTEYNAAPSLTREHSFTLLNRHPHALNMNDERGHQIELSYVPTDQLDFLVNVSQTFHHDGECVYNAYYGEIHRKFGDQADVRLAAAWNFDLTTNTECMTPLLDLLYDLGSREQIHLSYQHQHIINQFDKSEYDDEFLLIEYSRSPWLSLAMVTEYTNQNQLRNIDLNRNFWIYGSVSLFFRSNHQLSLLYGSRQAGFVCVGGICRYEPEFEGIEIKLINRF